MTSFIDTHCHLEKLDSTPERAVKEAIVDKWCVYTMPFFGNHRLICLLFISSKHSSTIHLNTTYSVQHNAMGQKDCSSCMLA